MDSPNPDALDERALAETPEDVAVLYSWANLQGAKYRDFSASRREYRAQMRHRQAEQVREEEMRGKAEAEAAAADAERAAREAEEAARFHAGEAQRASRERHVEDYRTEEEAKVRAMRHAAELNRVAAAERVEAARRAEAVAAAEAASRREEREMAEAQASAARQAARYEDSEIIRRSLAGPQPAAYVPGEISDPYMTEPVVLPGRLFHQPQVPQDDMQPTRSIPSREARLLIPQPDPLDREHLRDVKEYWVTGSIQEEAAIAAGGAAAIEEAAHKSKNHVSYYYDPNPQERTAAVDHYAHAAPYAERERQAERHVERQPERPMAQRTDAYADRAMERAPEPRYAEPSQPKQRAGVFEQQPRGTSIYGLGGSARVQESSVTREVTRKPVNSPMVDPIPGSPRPESSAVRAAHRSGTVEAAKVESASRLVARESSRPRKARGYRPDEASGVHPSYNGSAFGHDSPEPEGSVPAWINSSDSVSVARAARSMEASRLADQHAMEAVRGIDAPRREDAPRTREWVQTQEPQRLPDSSRVTEQQRGAEEQRSSVVRRPAVQQGSPVMDTLQHSRERVAARWYALKGVFDHQEQQEAAPVAKKDVRVPMLTVFSLAGGVGKTSLVATLGRALSSTGEKVLLTDTTSHGLLPFYFGASELRPGVVRTFSPPAGSNDAAIALVSYDVAQNNGDAAQQEWLNDELTQKSRGMQRLILDASPVSPWAVRRLAKMGSVVIVPVAPDMNSVISLGPVEKFFAGMVDADGRSVQPYYLLNQFDASLPLHLDVREVMRQQLGDRLLPFVIRRSPVVSEALAEGMTVIDHAPDAPVAADYMNFAQWLRTQSAPAASGLKNARWSER